MTAFVMSQIRAHPILRYTLAQAALIGLVATLAASVTWNWSRPVLTALERSPSDAWMRARAPFPLSPDLVLITRDAAGEAKFGTGRWDRAIVARMIRALSQAGAAVIGLDLPAATPSPPGHGGPASDAMLAEMTKSAGNVIYPLPLTPGTNPFGSGADATPDDPPLAHDSWWVAEGAGHDGFPAARVAAEALAPGALAARNLGHTLTLEDRDGTIRRVPLFVRVDQHVVPAFGLAVSAAFLQVPPDRITIIPGRSAVLRAVQFPDRTAGDLTIPLEDDGSLLINYAPQPAERTLPSRTFLDVWTALDENEGNQLRDWVGGKIVVLLLGLGQTTYRTPLDAHATERAIQLDLINTILTQQWLTEPSVVAGALLTWLLSTLAVWLLLTMRGWVGVLPVGLLLAGYPLATVLILSQSGVILPVILPLFGLLFGGGGALLWEHASARHRIQLLEQNIVGVQEDLAAVREALVHRETMVEALEEDLEAARATATRSTGRQEELARTTETLRAHLIDAKAQEEATRQRMQELETELSGLRAVRSLPAHLGSTEQERLRQEAEQLGILSRDRQVLAVFRDLKKGAKSSLPVLILGEPGTGKELFARAVHRLSPRAEQRFLAVNMAAISAELFESELFGHVKGSFTGAMADRKGYFELAHRGTIFLDEIGDLPLRQQGKLLRVLQEKTFYRVGATHPTIVDVRVVAATNKDLRRGVAEGWFREDLYFRLTGQVLRLPPLRERTGDIPWLAQQLVQDLAKRAERPDVHLTAEALEALERHPWYGNVRELFHCLEQAIVLSDLPTIHLQELRLPDAARTAATTPTEAMARAQAPLRDPESDEAVLAHLREHAFDMQAAAKALGWDRGTVTQRLKGMGFRALVESGGDRTKAALLLAGDPTLARAVELKLLGYLRHLEQTIAPFPSARIAITACRKRFKNLPDRHFKSLETLIRQHFDHSGHSH